MVQISYYRVQTSYCCEKTSYCRVQTSYFRVQGQTSYRSVQISYYRVKTSYCRVQPSYFRVQGAKLLLQGADLLLGLCPDLFQSVCHGEKSVQREVLLCSGEENCTVLLSY